MRCKIILALFFLVLMCTAVPAIPEGNNSFGTDTINPSFQKPEIILFIPSPTMIHSDQVMDIINTPDRDVLFGTSFGLSLYNGTWSTRHINRDNISAGLLDEFITAIEYDTDGNLWIGYSGGLQVYNGVYYKTYRDQQLLKDPRINDIQRWDDDMWVATGNSGLHQYRKGTWRWFQPMSINGPGFYEIHEMTLDPMNDMLVFATVDNGLWTARSSPENTIVFEQIAPKTGTYGLLQQVRRDPRGGVYFYNNTDVVHYSHDTGYIPVLTIRDLTFEQVDISSISAASDGKLYIATDNGIYIWDNGKVFGHLSRFEGIGTSEIVRTIFIDAQNRVWFSTQGYVGYFKEMSASSAMITIAVVTPHIQETQVITQPPMPDPTTIQIVQTPETTITDQGGLAPVLDPIIRAIKAILGKLGLG